MSADTIHTNDTTLHELWAVVNAKRRKGSTAVKVDAEALTGLLKDHHTLITALQSRKLLTVSLGPDHVSLSP